ncbi:hypothetical protein TIFTF001_027858 [Ficus carica]|uniref:Uncharacterized protein n=1 Tax=Ficus carica TaxID=3494 RepID=A0AA88DNX0_FICCA|nr:hypothetical protein TIFTF001_027858 [Ficus carica]
MISRNQRAVVGKAEFFPYRSEVQCLHRWQKVLNPELVKGPWTQEEDDKIIELVLKYGATKWSLIAKSLPGRIGKQCRERWHNHLNPDIRKDAWTLDEELALMNSHRTHGNKWAEIAKVLPGSSANSKAMQCKPVPSNMDLSSSNMDMSHKRPESVVNFDSCGISKEHRIENHVMNSEPKSQNCGLDNGGPSTEINEDHVLGTPLPYLTHGSLYYEPPKLEGCVPLDSSPFSSPASFYTPPSVKGNGLNLPSPESVLKMAALSFPNTPSILRKRKSKAETPFLPNKIQKSDAESNGNMLCGSLEQDSLDLPENQDGSVCESPTRHGTNSIGPNGKAFNASPPYRLRSKRTAMFKSVEKQLEFVFDKEHEGNMKSAKGNMNYLPRQRRSDAKDFSSGVPNNLLLNSWLKL